VSISKNIYLFVLFSSLFIISSFCCSSEIITVRVTHAPPHYFQNAEGHWTGSGVEIVKAVIHKAGYEPQYLSVPWMRALMLLEQGKLDLMMGLSNTEDRSKFLHWIGPVRNEEMTLIVRNDNIDFHVQSLDDIARIAHERKIPFGLQVGAFYGEHFELRIQQEEFEGVFTPNTHLKQSLGLTIGGRILGFFENKAFITHRIKENPEYKQLVVYPFIVNSAPVFYGISKKVSAEVYQNLQMAFDQLEQDGTLDNIRNKQW